MTEKRFTFDEDVNEDDMYEIGVFSDNGKVMETIDVLTYLNNLHDENEQLKKELESFKPIIFESDGKPVTLYKKGDVE